MRRRDSTRRVLEQYRSRFPAQKFWDWHSSKKCSFGAHGESWQPSSCSGVTLAVSSLHTGESLA